MKKQHHLFSLLSLVGFVTAISPARQPGVISINPKTPLMQDQYGRTVMMHGVNIVPKRAPYIPVMNGTFDPVFSLTDQEIDNLANWGFNIVRLGVMWEAVETAPGVYNDTYLDLMNDLINKLGSRGIFSLVDAHQDAVSKSTCGEGFPNFYAKQAKSYCDGGYIPWLADMYGACLSIKDYKFRTDQDGNPLVKDCLQNSFAQYYMTAESLDIFEQLYNPTAFQDKYIEFQKRVANRLQSNPFVVGYDPINEPFPSNVFKDPELVFEPGKFDRVALEPLYSRAFKEAYNSSKMMFFEAAEFPDEMGIFGGLVYNLGFTAPPGGTYNSLFHVVNDHTYCFQLLTASTKRGGAFVGRNSSQCRGWHEDRVGTRAQDAARYGIPLFISEFGGCGEDPDGVDEITTVGEVCDEHLAGWAYWQYKNYNDPTTTGEFFEGFYRSDGSLQSNKVKALARTYLMYTQGVLKSMKFDFSNVIFRGEYVVDATIKQPSVIYYSQEYWYPQGISISLIDSATQNELQAGTDYTVDLSEQNYAKVMFNNGSSYDGKQVTIQLSPKQAFLAFE